MLIALPTILKWMITSVAPDARLESALRRSKCSVDFGSHGFNTNDITTGAFVSHAEPQRKITTTQASGKQFRRFRWLAAFSVSPRCIEICSETVETAPQTPGRKGCGPGPMISLPAG